jgi:hypothetical protein
MSIDPTGAGVEEIVTSDDFPSDEAVMIALPALTATTDPPCDTLTMVVSLELQPTVFPVKTCPLPLFRIATAVIVSPILIAVRGT